jgi:hypothetical protein
MTCDACEKAAKHAHCGMYRMQCLECCTRLVLSTHPNKQLAAAMLASIEHFRNRHNREAPGRDAILESVRLTLERRRCHGQK